MLPTVIFYTAGKNKHAKMVGKFDVQTIIDQSDKFMNGKLPVFLPKTNQRDILIKDIDCSAQVMLADAYDGFDDILAEILAEEEAARQAKQDEEEDDTKTKPKKKKKGGKKGKKKEDL